MPYCPNCGDAVKDTYRYCGQCGQPLEDDIEHDNDGMPPSGRPPDRPGFLSDRSIEYINQLHKGEKEWDSELSGYAHLQRDVGGAFADLNLLTTVDELNVLLLVADFTGDDDVLEKGWDQLNTYQRRQRSAWHGVFNAPQLYDDALGMEWKDELMDRVTEFVDAVNAESSDTQES